MRKVMLANERFGFRQNGCCTRAIALCQFQAGENHLTRSDGVDTFHLTRELKAFSPMHFGSIQLIPLVIYPGKSKIRLAGNRPRRITCQLQDALVGLCCSVKLVFCLLYLAETKYSRRCVDGLPK